MTNADKMAFPGTAEMNDGLTKREWMAGMALQGLCAASLTALQDISDKAIMLADETLAKLEKTK